MIDLTIKTLDSQNHKFSVPNTFTILELKEFIASQVNVAVVEQRLIFCGRVLSNETKLADIGIDGKVMHLVQKVPRLSTTTPGSSSSTTTNTTSRSGQNAEPGFRGFHVLDPTELLDAIGIPSELIQARGTRYHENGSRVTVALFMISRANDALNRLEHPGPNLPQSSASNAEQLPEGSQQAETSSVPENVPVGGSPNQSSAEQATRTLPFSASSEQPFRNDRQTSENRPTAVVNDWQHLRELIEEFNKLNERFRPFYARHCQFIIDGPQFDSTEGEHGAQYIFDSVSEIMHSISHVYHEISDIRVAFNRTPRHSFQSRPCLLQGNISHAAHSVTTTTVEPPSTQQPTSTQTTTTRQPSQGLARGPWNSTLRMDPFVPRSSHHFEPNLRPVVLARRSSQRTNRSTSSATSGNSTTDTSSPSSSNEVRTFTSLRRGRSRTRYLQQHASMICGISPSTEGTQSNNTDTTSASNITQATGQRRSITEALFGQIRVRTESVFNTLEREEDFDRSRDLNLPPASNSVLGFEQSMSTSTSQSTPHPPNGLLTTPIGEIPYFRSLEGRSLLVDLFLMVSRYWTLRDVFSVNLTSETSTLRINPIATHSEELINFILDRIMLNLPPSNQNIEDAANRIFLEIVPYINVFQCTLPTPANINVNASFRRCILQNLREIINYCGENRMGAIDNIVYLLSLFAEGFLSLIVYCCNSRPIFRLCVSAVMQYLPLPSNVHLLIMNELLANIDQYWERMDTFHMMNVLVIGYIVPLDEAAQLLRASNNGEQSSNPSMRSSENINEPPPEVVIGSQDWHHNVPSVPVIARRSQRQRRQGTQPPYSDAYLSGVPNKRRR